MTMPVSASERYAVYHANDPHAMVAPRAEDWYRDRSTHYTHVADVVAPLTQVFALTNHIDHPWTENPQVIWHTTASPVRSTSVGDVIVSRQSGRAWLVMPMGLRELSREDDPRLEATDGGRTGVPQPPPAGEEGRL